MVYGLHMDDHVFTSFLIQLLKLPMDNGFEQFAIIVKITYLMDKLSIFVHPRNRPGVTIFVFKIGRDRDRFDFIA